MASPGVPLLVGIFAGRDSAGVLKVYIARIAIDDSLPTRESTVVPIGYAIDELAPREEPYSTHAVTQELIEGQTNRSKKVAKLWKEKMMKASAEESRIDWLEFLIERTGDYDEDVAAPVNAARVVGDNATWLLDRTCSGSDHP